MWMPCGLGSVAVPALPQLTPSAVVAWERMAQPSPAETEFRARPWLKLVAFSALALFSAGAVYGFYADGPSLMAISFSALAVLGLAGVVEVLRVRVVLREAEIVISSGWRSRRLPRTALERVTWAKGGGVSLGLEDGSWAKLPEMGYNSQSLANGIRAWLKRTEGSAGRPEGARAMGPGESAGEPYE